MGAKLSSASKNPKPAGKDAEPAATPVESVPPPLFTKEDEERVQYLLTHREEVQNETVLKFLGKLAACLNEQMNLTQQHAKTKEQLIRMEKTIDMLEGRKAELAEWVVEFDRMSGGK